MSAAGRLVCGNQSPRSLLAVAVAVVVAMSVLPRFKRGLSQTGGHGPAKGQSVAA